MLFTERGRGGLLVKPRPLSGCKLKLRSRAFCRGIVCFGTINGSFTILKKAGRKFSKKDYFRDFSK
jgi:hypothetical protein